MSLSRTCTPQSHRQDVPRRLHRTVAHSHPHSGSARSDGSVRRSHQIGVQRGLCPHCRPVNAHETSGTERHLMGSCDTSNRRRWVTPVVRGHESSRSRSDSVCRLRWPQRSRVIHNSVDSHGHRPHRSTANQTVLWIPMFRRQLWGSVPQMTQCSQGDLGHSIRLCQQGAVDGETSVRLYFLCQKSL